MLSLIFSVFSLLFLKNWGSLLLVLVNVIYFFLLCSYEFFFLKISSLFECDIYSMSLVILRLWLIVLRTLARYKIKLSLYRSLFLFTLNVLLLFLIFSFCVNNYVLFYLSFECSVIPIIFLVIGWGYQPERTQAGLYLLFYTLIASLPLLLIILRNSYFNGSFIGVNNYYYGSCGGIYNLFLLGAFLVKFPIYGVHLWLPKAHVEAPVAGSIILAGILLKLGGYGIMRFIYMINSFPNYLQTILITLSVWGGVVVSFICLNHIDIKSLIAYSSVVHISTCISCILTISEYGYKGAFIIIIAHGISSSGLFFLIALVYNRTNSRSLKINKGLINIIPSMSLVWFGLLSSNIAAPPFINLLAEINIICCILHWSSYIFILLIFLIFFSACYNLFFFSTRQHGKFLFSKQSFFSGYKIEYLVRFLHIFPLLIFILFIDYMLCFFSLF